MNLKGTNDSETAAEGMQVITASAFIHHTFDGIAKVFLPKRADTKKFLPGVYEMPGGHIDFGEDIINGLKREIREELSMEISVGDPFSVFTYKNAVKGSHSVEAVFFAVFINPIEEIKLNPQDHSGFGWFGADEIQSIIGANRDTEVDNEFRSILKGFSLLTGNSLNFG